MALTPSPPAEVGGNQLDAKQGSRAEKASMPSSISEETGLSEGGQHSIPPPLRNSTQTKCRAPARHFPPQGPTGYSQAFPQHSWAGPATRNGRGLRWRRPEPSTLTTVLGHRLNYLNRFAILRPYPQAWQKKALGEKMFERLNWNIQGQSTGNNKKSWVWVWYSRPFWICPIFQPHLLLLPSPSPANNSFLPHCRTK